MVRLGDSMNIFSMDSEFIRFFRKISDPLSRFAIFTVYFWFGLLKTLGLSPASEMVRQLAEKTVNFMPFPAFYMMFSWFEVLIGVLFLFPRLTRVVIPLLIIHMIAAALPLFFLPAVSWQSFLVPTLQGQYIIKNLVIIACAVGIAGRLHNLKK